MSSSESHKEILLLRLATRKAEQALQKRHYEHNMELMRQRVKSAPLLLEGLTFWGNQVGKLTHNCPNEGIRHNCESLSQRKPVRKKNTTSNRNTTRTEYSESTDRCSKMNTLRRVYSTQSRNTTRSAKDKGMSGRRTKTRCEMEGHDSADELSSLDRAYL